MGVMCADQKQQYRHRQQELLGWGILVAAVDLLPHVQVVVSTSVELKRHTSDPVKHEERAGHISDVGEGPGRLLRAVWNNIKEDLEKSNDDKVDCPSTCIFQRR